MAENEMRLQHCCFTGHRPKKLIHNEDEVCYALKKEIRQAYADGYNVFITGMACGVDIWAAEIVLDFQKRHKNIKLICASPFEGFERRWTSAWQKRYRYIMKNANLVHFISPSYSRSCFQLRNEWMVDRSARVIAVFNGEKGGTRKTIEYAKKHNVEIRMTELA